MNRKTLHWLPVVKDKFVILSALVIVVVLILSGFQTYSAASKASHSVKDQLRKQSQTIAASLNSSLISSLSGTEDDEATPAYKTLKQTLADIKAPNPSYRSIYLTGSRDGRLYFYVDSENPDSSQYSPAGEYYDDATNDFKNLFNNGQTLVEGPVSDSFGTFISGLAPIFYPNSHKVLAVLGIDVDAATYRKDILSSALIPLLTSLLIVLIIFAFDWVRRRNQQLLNVRSELVSVASHDLRTPVTGIMWASELLQSMKPDEKARKIIDNIHNSSLKLQESINDIMELSHTMNRRKLTKTDVDLVKLIQDIVETQALSTQQKDMKIIFDPSWPASLVLNCDGDRMKRAFHNIISNAIKYSLPHSNVVLSYQAGEDGHHLYIQDTGIGIPQDEQARVFNGFYRASNAVASTSEGTGLGLYLVRLVMQQHGGKVSFVSEENKGTKFDLLIPED